VTTNSPVPVVRVQYLKAKLFLRYVDLPVPDITGQGVCTEILIESRKMAIKTYQLIHIAFLGATMNQE
jgi:hypothetical protein